MTVFNERVRELRPAYLPPDPAGRTTYDAVILCSATCGFDRPRSRSAMGQTRPPMQLPVLTMVLAYTRWLASVDAADP